jgi:hypothetical protein
MEEIQMERPNSQKKEKMLIMYFHSMLSLFSRSLDKFRRTSANFGRGWIVAYRERLVLTGIGRHRSKSGWKSKRGSLDLDLVVEKGGVGERGGASERGRAGAATWSRGVGRAHGSRGRREPASASGGANELHGARTMEASSH